MNVIEKILGRNLHKDYSGKNGRLDEGYLDFKPKIGKINVLSGKESRVSGQGENVKVINYNPKTSIGTFESKDINDVFKAKIKRWKK